MIMPTPKDKTLVGDSNMAALGYDIFTNAADRSRCLFNKDSNHYIPLYRRDTYNSVGITQPPRPVKIARPSVASVRPSDRPSVRPLGDMEHESLRRKLKSRKRLAAGGGEGLRRRKESTKGCDDER